MPRVGYRPGTATPVESVAVLSDIHGVLPVLDAVLAQPEVRAADAIAAFGPRDGRQAC